MRLFPMTFLLLACGAAVCQTPPPAPPQAPAQGQSGPPPGTRRLDPPPGGMPFVHDPSTVIRAGGKYYVYTTGRGIPMLSSPDMVNWTRLGSVFPQIPERVHAAVPKNNGMDVWAPDIIRLGNTFYLYYAVSSWGSFQSVVALATNTTLDPADPAYKWVDRGVVVGSDGVEDMNDIDPGVVRAPDGTLWICYGSYHGSIEVLQLDPKTGLALAGGKGKTIVSRQSEAADMIVHDGYFYLFVNHGSCCQGKNSQYNIRVGRSRSATGPYLDKHGVALTEGGGSLFLAAHDHRIGPGHFGRVIEETDETGMERFSLHYEADLSNLGRPTLGVRPLLWPADGWPVAGDSVAGGIYQIQSAATENTLEIHSAPGREGALRLGRYLAVEEQQWSVEPVGGGFYKVVNLRTKTALGAASGADGTLEWSRMFSGTDEQMWRLDQATDGNYRLLNKAAGKSLTAGPEGKLTLAADAGEERQRWVIASP